MPRRARRRPARGRSTRAAAACGSWWRWGRTPRSCCAPDELAAAVDDEPGGHVDDQGDREQDQAGGDEGGPSDAAGLTELVGDVGGDAVAVRAEYVPAQHER